MLRAFLETNSDILVLRLAALTIVVVTLLCGHPQSLRIVLHELSNIDDLVQGRLLYFVKSRCAQIIGMRLYENKTPFLAIG